MKFKKCGLSKLPNSFSDEEREMKDYGDPPKIDPGQAARKGVPELAPYIPGKPIHEVQKEYGLKEVIKLASNECPLALPDSIAKKILEETQFLCRYPDGHCTRLRISLAQRLKVPPECLLFGNGADECIQLIALAFLNQGDEVLIPSPSFDSYERFTRMAGAEVIHVPLKDYRIDLDEVLDRINNRTKMIWLCSPNNPTGAVLPGKEFERFLERISEGIVVILDEAYREYVSTKNSAHAEDYLFDDGRVIGLRTFSKAFGLAGLRVGYLIGHPSVVEIIAKVRLPFNVNNLAQAAALCALKEEDFVKHHIGMIRK